VAFLEPSHWVCKPALFGACPKQDKLGELWQKGHFSVKMRGWWRWATNSLDGVLFRRVVGAFASVIFPCAIKSRR